MRHYGPGHPVSEQAVRRLDADVRQALTGAPEVRWDASPVSLIVQDTLLPGDDAHVRALRDHLGARGIGRVRITAEAQTGAIAALVRLLSREPEELLAEGGAVDAVRAAGAAGIAVEAPEPVPVAPAETDEYRSALTAYAALFAAVERGERPDVGRAQLLVERLDPPAGRDGALWEQVALRGHDELDPPHAVHTAFLAMRLAGALGMSPADRIETGVAALLHDIGMAVLPWEQRLAERTPGVRDPLPGHAVGGGRLLRHLGGRGSLPMLAAVEHHRVIAGGGAAAAPVSRIVALADYVEAMTCGRAAGLRPDTLGALMARLLEGGAPAFDPLHVRLLSRLLAASGWDGEGASPA